MKRIIAVRVAVAWLSIAASASHAEGTIKDYLFNHTAGPVAANDIINMAGSAVSSLQTPKDLTIALGALGNRDTQAGFGISVTPARTALPVLALQAGKYADGDVLSRLWGGTTLSYAQNKKSLASTDYAQSALAINVTYQLRAEDDPIIVAYNALRDSEAGICKDALEALETADQSVEAFKRRRIAEEETRLNRPLNLEELQKISADAPAQHADTMKKLGALRNCAHDAATAVAKKWNASRLQVVLGQGWIQSPVADAGRLTLGKFATLSLAWPAGDHGLINFTLRRVADDLDLKTIASTPTSTTTNSGGARYTYKAGNSNDLYGIAEASSVKASTPTSSNAAFKYALGVDRKVAESLWLEFRFGRSHTADGTKLENKALFSLKFSPETTLDKQIK